MNKLTEQELAQIQELKKQYQDLLYNLGVIEMQFKSLDKQKQIILNNLEKIQNEEQELTNDLTTRYGENIQVNIDNGEII